MSSELIERIFSLYEQNNPLIAVESPLQERMNLLKNLTQKCINSGINCYLWMLEDDKLYQLTISDSGLAFSEIQEYNRIAFKVVREDSFEILRFWKTSQLQGILILEGIYPWLGQGATDADFFLTAEWIKSALINIKLYNDNSGKTALLLGSNASLKSDIAGLIPIITQELPTVEEISDYLPQILPDSITQAQINEIANTCVGMYLADIETGVKTALAFGEQTPAPEDLPPLEITLTALLESRKNVNPLAIREADRIESMRNIADLQGLPSSPVDSSIYSLGDIDIFGS
ncbi:hypothetical protein [Nostoc sphaeroides]|nr:hypothetical protein [Nostoc sphaeroides]